MCNFVSFPLLQVENVLHDPNHDILIMDMYFDSLYFFLKKGIFEYQEVVLKYNVK